MTYEEMRFRNHLEGCTKCQVAKKRVNDFCPTGLLLFQEWNPKPVSAKLLSQEESDKVWAEHKKRTKTHDNN